MQTEDAMGWHKGLVGKGLGKLNCSQLVSYAKCPQGVMMFCVSEKLFICLLQISALRLTSAF